MLLLARPACENRGARRRPPLNFRSSEIETPFHLDLPCAEKRGKLVRTLDRRFPREEWGEILDVQRVEDTRSLVVRHYRRHCFHESGSQVRVAREGGSGPVCAGGVDAEFDRQTKLG